MGNEHGKAGGTATPAGIQSMDETLQKKFSKGIQFNMKIVLKGDRNTGKTCLFHRMGGKGFLEAYLPTSEIQVSSILWSYKVTNDTVKVEVWDIVDKGRVPKRDGKGMLKIFNDSAIEDEEAGEGKVLDASFLDVYKGCHGVVLVFDMTKIWTWKYVERELPKVPLHIPVMILGNFRDMGDHRAIMKDEVIAFVESQNRPDGAAEVMYAESSMKNAFGLMHLHKFLSVPFLQLQQEMLLQQLQVNREQMMAATDELFSASNSEDQSYDMFSAKLQQAAEERRRKIQQQQQQESQEESDTATAPRRRSTMDSEHGSSSSSNPHLHAQATPTPETPPTSQGVERSRGSSGKQSSKLSSRFSGFLSRNKEKTEASKGPVPVSPRGSTGTKTSNIDDFVADGEVDSFLDDEGEDDEVDRGDSEEDSSEEEDANPVMAVDEDLSSLEEEDTPPSPPKRVFRRDKPAKPAVQLKSAKDIELTESEEEEEEEEEKEEQQTVPRRTGASKQKDLEVFWGQANKSADGGSKEGEGRESGGKSKPKAKAKSSGLMLNWAVPEPAKPQKKKESPKESPDLLEERRERHKKKSKKSSSKRREREAEAAASNGPTVSSTTATLDAQDPFGVNTSLDAWLNAGDILQPSSPHSRRVEKGEEVGEEEEESSLKRSKKHHHRRHGETSSSSGSRKKKKQKSRHSDKDGEQLGEYNLL